MRRHLFFVVLGTALALLSGLFVLTSHGSVQSVHAASGPTTTFTIAPGDAERVPLNRSDGVCTLAEAVEAANDQGASNPPLNDCGDASPGLNIIELQAGNYDLTAQVASHQRRQHGHLQHRHAHHRARRHLRHDHDLPHRRSAG